MNCSIIRAVIGEIDRFSGELLPNEVRYTSDSAQRPRKDLIPRLRAKYFKTCQHELLPSATHFVWADGSYRLSPGVDQWLFQYLGDADVVFIQHPSRTTVGDEVTAVEAEMAKGDRYLIARYSGEDMRGQYDSYLRTGFPDIMLLAGGLFLRRNTPAVNRAFEDWFLETVKWTIQDQISLPYILWKHGISVNILDSTYLLNGPFHTYIGHTVSEQ